MSHFFKHFGGTPSKTLQQRYAESKNWKDKSFQNLEETSMNIGLTDLPGLLYKQLFNKKGRQPLVPLPIKPFDLDLFLAPSLESKFIWYGHSVILLRISNKTVLIDPMLGPDAAPIAPFKSGRFSENTLEIIDSLPEIDLLLMTHDHYDHLDLASIERLQGKVKRYFVGLGVGRHLESWGTSPSTITEFDWWDSQVFEDLNITYTPTRHFSGRGATDRAKSLWGGWALKSSNENVWFSGDGGYGNHFKEIGDKLGGFDFAFLECGQYNELWHQIHMYPEEAVLAAYDAKANKIMPVHWAGFALALHHWKEPVERFVKAAKEKKSNYLIPELGELVHISGKSNNPNWYDALE